VLRVRSRLRGSLVQVEQVAAARARSAASGS